MPGTMLFYLCLPAMQSFEHQVDGSKIDHGFAAFRQVLVVLTQTSISIQPCNGSLHNPTARQNDKAFLIWKLLNNLDCDAMPFLHPLDEVALISLIGPNLDDLLPRPDERVDQILAAFDLMKISRANQNAQKIPLSINDEEPLSPFDFFSSCPIRGHRPFQLSSRFDYQ